MPRISPFQALVYEPSVAGPLDRVTAPPYDVITDRRRRDYLSASPFSVVHLDLAEGTDDPAHPESRYARAAQLLADWERTGAVVRMPEPTYFVYEMLVTHKLAGRWPDVERSIADSIEALSSPRLHRSP